MTGIIGDHQGPAGVAQKLEPRDPRKVGPYWLLGRLGSGGMGQVFLGRSPGGRLIAVKVVRAELAEQAEFRNRFAREVAAARKVSGLFTAPVVDADVDAPVPWLATAYVPGPSIAEAITRHGPLPATSVLALAAGLAEGLGAIHAAGIVHRDLKPSNVLLAEDGPRIIDFGISRAAEASMLTGTGVVFGSPSFMSPEQARGHRVGPPSDVFSLGAVLTFAATGEGPFGTALSATLLYRVVFAPPDVGGLPVELRPLVERCLAKDPEQRPSTEQLLAELNTAPPASGWLPAPITEAFPSHPASDPGAAAATAVGDLSARPVTQPAAAPGAGVPVSETPTVTPGDMLPLAAAETEAPGGSRGGGRPGRSRLGLAAAAGGRAHNYLSHCGHDRAPASVQQGVIRALVTRTSDDRPRLNRTSAIPRGDARGHFSGDLPGHFPGDHAGQLLPGHLTGQLLPGHLAGQLLPGHLAGNSSPASSPATSSPANSSPANSPANSPATPSPATSPAGSSPATSPAGSSGPGPG